MAPRIIDSVPEPTKPKKMKVVVASASRTGTLGLYSALKTLGYKPYHFLEVITSGSPHMEIMRDAMLSNHNRFSGMKPYELPDFKKWLADYDAVVEVLSYIGPESLAAMAEDPDVKFILTERDPDKWVLSFNKTCGELVRAASAFPLKYLRHFNYELGLFLQLNEICYQVWADGRMPWEADADEHMRKNYISYISNSKKVLPKERTQVIRLEDGLGWEQICPFLGHKIPKDEEYPRGNEPEKFQKLAEAWLNPRIQNAMMKMAAIALPALGGLAWAGYKYGPSLYNMMSR